MIPTGGWFTLQWHITHRCNLRCTHCYQDDYAAFGSREALANVLDQYDAMLHACGFKGYLNVTGGEPLTHPDLFWLLREARERGVTTAVLSNGTLIGRREAVRLQACGVDYVQISLDGMERTHDAIRGKGSFARAVAGIRALRERKIFVTVSFTAQRGNLGELPKLARFCDDIGVNKLWYDRVVIPAAEDKDHRCRGGDEQNPHLAGRKRDERGERQEKDDQGDRRDRDQRFAQFARQDRKQDRTSPPGRFPPVINTAPL